ncbi:helix-turn-helix transcriptional regulator [Streptomyces sp. NPDC001889]
MTDTPARLLNLLSLLQTPREWPGSELAQRLEVSKRTIRRDIDRLRDLGYPVEATRGAVGGYRLVAGAAMPPLLLDDEEAVAIAVGLRAGAGHAIEGVEEASVRALAKLEQVLPSRLRYRVNALQAATIPLTQGDGATIDPRTLTAIAGAASGEEQLRFDYRSADGTPTKRLVEPYRLISTGYRWYLVAYDTVREDWRTFRVDRVSEPLATGARFTPRELPAAGAEALLSHGVAPPEKYEAEVGFDAPAALVRARLPESFGMPEATGEASCLLRLRSSYSTEWLVFRLALVGCDFTVHGPPELAARARALGARLTRAATTPAGAAREQARTAGNGPAAGDGTTAAG